MKQVRGALQAEETKHAKRPGSRKQTSALPPGFHLRMCAAGATPWLRFASPPWRLQQCGSELGAGLLAFGRQMSLSLSSCDTPYPKSLSAAHRVPQAPGFQLCELMEGPACYFFSN